MAAMTGGGLNRLILDGLRIRLTECQDGPAVIAIMPALMPAPTHVAAPRLYVTGTRFSMESHTWRRAGDPLLTLHPTLDTEASSSRPALARDGRHGAYLPREVQLTFRSNTHISNGTVRGVAIRLEEYLRALWHRPRAFGVTLEFPAFVHPTTGLVSVRLPGTPSGPLDRWADERARDEAALSCNMA